MFTRNVRDSFLCEMKKVFVLGKLAYTIDDCLFWKTRNVKFIHKQNTNDCRVKSSYTERFPNR
jgi:hypothetical protein